MGVWVRVAGVGARQQNLGLTQENIKADVTAVKG